MKRVLAFVAAMACVFSLNSLAFAGPGCCKSKAAAASASAACAAEFPHLVMKVGEKEFECPMAAEKEVKDHGGKVVFAVAGENFVEKDAAMAALADASEEYVHKFTSIACKVDGQVIFCGQGGSCKDGAKLTSTGSKSCSGAAKASAEAATGCSKSKEASAKGEGSGCCKSKAAALAKSEGTGCSKGKDAMADCAKACEARGAKFMVVGKTFDKYTDAVKARDAALAVLKDVNMKYIVDGKEVSCSSQVCPTAKKAGKVQYVVGTEKTGCEISARISLAKAQYEAAKNCVEKQVAKM